MSCTPAIGNNNNRGNISSNFLNSLPFGSFAESWVAKLVQLCKWIVYWQECHLQPVLHKHCTIILTNCTPNWQRGKIVNWELQQQQQQKWLQLGNWQSIRYTVAGSKLFVIPLFILWSFGGRCGRQNLLATFFPGSVLFSYLNYGTYRCLWRSELTVLSVALAAKYYNLYA